MSFNLNDLFPELNKKQQHFFSEEELQNMPYFRQMLQFVPSKQISTAIKKSKHNFKLLNIKKGTVIYTAGMSSPSGYFLCHGSVVLLIKKSYRQQIYNLPKQFIHLPEQRVNFLNKQFGIPLNKCQVFLNQFYEEKVLFKLIEYQTLYGEGYFGFSDLLKSSNRNFTAIATEDTILLQLQKNHFETSLKDLQLKKQDFIIKNILENLAQDSAKQIDKPSSSMNKQIYLKMSQIFNYFTLKKYDRDEIIFRQNQPCRNIFFILKGQIQLKKTFKMDLPKKMLKDQNKPPLAKQVQVKVSRLSQKCYLGESQFFVNTKIRQFTAQSVQNDTILVQIEPTFLIKMIGQFPVFQKDLVVSAKQKFSIANQNFIRQKNKVIKSFLLQFQNIENKKKQKIITNLLLDDQNHKNHINGTNSATFQIFSKEGVYFRDTYEKLQGFGEFQSSQANNKRAAIRKYRLETTHLKNQQRQENQLARYPSINLQKGQDDDFQLFDSKQRLLYSPKKNLNILDFMSSEQISPLKDNRQPIASHQNSSKMRRKHSLGKFHELKRDEAVFKRVLIKNGKFQHDKTTFKSNIIKPIVHPKFDDIIKQCMSRKNQVIRKAIGQNKMEFVKDTYQNTVQTLKNKSLFISKFSNYSLTCLGTEQFKKKLEFYNKNQRRSGSISRVRNQVAVQEQNLQACIGVNQAPKSSQQKYRNVNEQDSKRLVTNISNNNFFGVEQSNSSKFASINSRSSTAFVSKRQSPEKMILLNHMMKPMIYSSVQY